MLHILMKKMSESTVRDLHSTSINTICDTLGKIEIYKSKTLLFIV